MGKMDGNFVKNAALIGLGGPLGAAYAGYKSGGMTGAITSGLGGGLVAMKVVAANEQAKQQNELLRNQEMQEEYNARMDKAESDFNLSQKQKEIQENLARTLASQNNIFGASGQSQGLTAGQIIEGTVNKAGRDESFVNSMAAYNQKAFDANRAFSRQNYALARRNNKFNAKVESINSLLDFGIKAASIGMGGA